MRKNVDISEEQLETFITQFYDYFESGYAFEEFLKVFLEKMGLDEVEVTQRSRDGGIDLRAVRYGVGNLGDGDSVEYYIQAKRHKPGTTIPIGKVRELRGVMPTGSKGIFITTVKYSNPTVYFAKEDNTSPIVLIDGKTLIESCIDNEIGFVFSPVFSKNAMDALQNESSSAPANDLGFYELNQKKLVIEKEISTNDIRAKILRIPKAVISRIDKEQKILNVIFNGLPERKLKSSV